HLISSQELNSVLQGRLARSNSPQFYGNATFPMGVLPQSVKSKEKVLPQHNVEPSRPKADAIIMWKQQLEQYQNYPKELAPTIDALTKDNSNEAKAKLGYLYLKGIGVPKDAHKALTYLIPASLEKNSFAQYNLGVMYSSGIAVDTNVRKALEYYTLAAKNGNPFAQHNLGSYYYKKSTQLLDEAFKTAIFWFLKSAQNGLPESQTALGILYAKLSSYSAGDHQKLQFKKIALWYYQKAATQEFGYGQYLLAKHYSEKLPLDSDKATYWLKKACGNDYLRACSALLNNQN
ncbi:MAG: tetratricopeptide repeat protein, partial [Marinirhabdus sp.]|nr:tetratricopeptide repeat protein [Marinirhabdus sp.]